MLKAKLGGAEFELKTAINEINNVKETGIGEIRAEVEEQKGEIKLLINHANSTKEELERQKEAIGVIIASAKELQEKIEKQKMKIVEMNNSAKNTKQEIEKLNAASEEVALSLVRTAYFIISTKNELGSSARIQKAHTEILEDMDRVLPIIIPDEKERAEWVNNLENTLPKRN